MVKTLNIALDEELLRDVDQAVKQDKANRSEYFRRLALDDLARRREWKELFDWGNQLGQQSGVKSEEQVYNMIADYKREKRSRQD